MSGVLDLQWHLHHMSEYRTHEPCIANLGTRFSNSVLDLAKAVLDLSMPYMYVSKLPQNNVLPSLVRRYLSLPYFCYVIMSFLMQRIYFGTFRHGLIIPLRTVLAAAEERKLLVAVKKCKNNRHRYKHFLKGLSTLLIQIVQSCKCLF
jgi:hypothetical protein